MADPRPPSRRELGVWPLVLAAIVIIAAAYWFFTDEAGIKAPKPLPDSPVATGTVGEPAGDTGPAPQPGAEVGADLPAGAKPVGTPETN